MLTTLSNFLFFFLLQANADNLLCQKGKVSQVEFGKTKNEIVDFCFNSKKTIFVSKDCQLKKCSAFESIKKYKIDDLLSPVGKPSFKLCRELSGKPQLVEFYVENKPYKLDRCLFNNGSFVDTDFLLSHYLER